MSEKDAGTHASPSTEDSSAAWDAIATGYDRVVTPTHVTLAEEGLRHAGLREGMRFLDVAAGSGALSIPAARLGARVVATDLSPLMLDRLAERARRENVDIETRVMDGHALDLDDESFDIAGSQFGVMLFPDMPKGLREMVRVVRPGGNVLMIVFGDPARVEFLGFLIRAVQSVRPDFEGPPMDPPPLPFQLREPATLHRELTAAGLKDVRVEITAEVMQFETGTALWDWLVSSNPIVEEILGSLNITDDERETIRQTLDRLVDERTGGRGPAALTSPINIGIGTK